MKNIIIGTAGHIDHGKTTLVKFLTGKNTDTLPDEKRRGITIDIGFSYLDLGNGKKAGVIDVPGHEKFIKNMTAGVSGIDYLILTAACDDGVMPQTEEHFKIAELLGIKQGIIVLTKTDLADEERIKEVREQLKTLVKNSFLENAETAEVSIKNPSSYENLKNIIIKDINSLQISERENEPFRMYIDRCFSVKGFGTVVTGTSLAGKISVGDIINIYPLKIKSKVKGIEVHGEKRNSAEAGNRIALNLAGVEKSQINRGDIVSEEENFIESKRVDIMFTALEKISVKNNQRIRFHIGTKEVIGRIRFFGQDVVEEKGRYPAQLLLEENITGIYGEFGIIRNFSPLYTVGGVKILNISGEKVKRSSAEYIEKLLELDKTGKFSEQEKNILNSEYLENILEDFHEKNRLKRGVLRAELKNRYFPQESLHNFRNFIDENISLGIIKSETVLEKEYISLKNFKIKLTKEEKQLKEIIFKKYKEQIFNFEKYENIKKQTADKNFDIIHNYMAEENMIIFLGEDYWILRGYLTEAEKQIRDFLNKNGKITISEFRGLLGINRKSALLILEKSDSLGITERISDYRILKNKI